MSIASAVKSEIAYAKDIVEAGLEAAHQPGTEVPEMPSFSRVSQSALAPAAIGAIVGILGICLTQRKNRGQGAILGGLIGCALGFSGGVAWSTRNQTSAVARNALKNVKAVRDQHWLQKHPIAYA